MTIKKEYIDVMMEAIDVHGLVTTLYEIFGEKVRVKMLFSQSDCKASIDELDLSTRSQNALKRAGIDTLDAVIEALTKNRLKRIRNLGNKSLKEIQLKMLCYGYKQSSPEEKYQFLEWMCKANTIKSCKELL